jgi:23S rRNA pseudouridine2604 synthase
MCEYLGYDVIGLKHINQYFTDIPMGRYRDLTDAEIKELELIEPSSKTEEASLPRTKLLKENGIHQKDDPRFKKKGDY